MHGLWNVGVIYMSLLNPGCLNPLHSTQASSWCQELLGDLRGTRRELVDKEISLWWESSSLAATNLKKDYFSATVQKIKPGASMINGQPRCRIYLSVAPPG